MPKKSISSSWSSSQQRPTGYRPKYKPQEHGQKMFDLGTSHSPHSGAGDNKNVRQHQRFADDDDVSADNDQRPQQLPRDERDAELVYTTRKGKDRDKNRDGYKGKGKDQDRDKDPPARSSYLTTSNVLPPKEANAIKELNDPQQQHRYDGKKGGKSSDQTTDDPKTNSTDSAVNSKATFESRRMVANKLQSSSSSPSAQNYNRATISPASSPTALRHTRGKPIDMPSLSRSTSDEFSSSSSSLPSLSPSFKSARPLASGARDNNKNNRNRAPIKKRVEAVSLQPELPSSIEAYEALDYKQKMRLGDDIRVRNMIREQEGTEQGHWSRSRYDHTRDDEGKGGKKENKKIQRGKDREQKPQRKQAIYEAQHQDLRRAEGVSDPESDLEDEDLFAATPQGTKSIDGRSKTLVSSKDPASVSTTSASSVSLSKESSSYPDLESAKDYRKDGRRLATTSLKTPPASKIGTLRRDISSDNDNGSDAEDFQKETSFSSKTAARLDKDKRKPEVKGTVRRSKLLVVQESDRRHYRDIFGYKFPASSVSSKSTAKEREEQERIKQHEQELQREAEFFDLSRSRPTPVSNKGKGDKNDAQEDEGRRRREPIPRTKQITKAARLIQQPPPIKTLRTPSSPVMRPRQSNQTRNQYDDLDLLGLSEDEKLKTRNKKRRKSVATDESSTEDDDSRAGNGGPRPKTRSRTPLSAHVGVEAQALRGDSLMRSPETQRTPRRGERSGFQLPSPSKKRTKEMPFDLAFLSDDDIPSIMSPATNRGSENVCPYCGDPLPKKMPRRLARALAKVLAKLNAPDTQQRQQQQQQEQRRQSVEIVQSSSFGWVRQRPLSPSRGRSKISVDSGQRDLRIQLRPTLLPRRPNRESSVIEIDSDDDINNNHRGINDIGDKDDDNYTNNITDSDEDIDGDGNTTTLATPKLSWVDKYEFCRIHILEETVVPEGLQLDYPMNIRFEDLPARVAKMHDELRGIIEGRVQSMFLERALKNYERMGAAGARNPMVLLAKVEDTMPGYYGPKGSEALSRILADLFVETNILTHERAQPQRPIEYIEQVLVPEAGLRLIAEDRTNLRRPSAAAAASGEGQEPPRQQQEVSLEEALE
ncbi:hypothetical protein BGZ98_002229, partial [Dissophora globulifera]